MKKYEECKICGGIGSVLENKNLPKFIDCNSCGGTGKDTSLSFQQLRKTNVTRCETDIRSLDSWSHLEWGACVAGEVGELLNFLKKMKRGEKINKKDLEHELGDIITYVDLLAASLDIDLGESVRKKFNIVSKRWNSKFKL